MTDNELFKAEIDIDVYDQISREFFEWYKDRCVLMWSHMAIAESIFITLE